MYPFIELAGNKFGSFPLCVGIGLGSGAILVFWQLKRLSVSSERENAVMLAIPLTFIAGVAGAYLLDAFLHGGWLAIFRKPTGWGVTFYGWLLAAIGFISIYAKISKVPASFILNLFCPGFIIAHAWGRVGCFLGGCCYGCPSKWGVVYPPGSFPYSRCGATPLLPVQLFECVYLLIVFVIVFFFIRFKHRAVWYIILSPAGRFVLEFFRGDDRGQLLGKTLSPSQWISIGLFAAGVLWLMKLKHKENGIRIRRASGGGRSSSTV